MVWIEESGKRKWISSKKARRHIYRGVNTEIYKQVKIEEHAKWKIRKGIKPKNGGEKDETEQ